MQALDVKKLASSSEIDLKDVSWLKSIKDAYRLRASIIARFSKERCISLAT
jgi:hypothetical protein